MKYSPLGRSGLDVSRVCQADVVPPRPQTQGATERIIDAFDTEWTPEIAKLHLSHPNPCL